MLYSPSKSLQFGGIKNEGLEVVQTPPNPSKSLPSFLKKHPNKVIKLLSLPLLYSTPPPSPNIQTYHKFNLLLQKTTTDATCEQCKIGIENSSHALFFCLNLQGIWDSV